MHFFRVTLGAIWECWLSLPSREAQPMPRFLRVPPNPDSSCPLKWATLMKASASTMSAAMETGLKMFLMDRDLGRRIYP